MLAFASDVWYNGIWYTVDETNKTASVRRNYFESSIDHPYSGDIVIPSEIYSGETAYRVTAIGDRAFNECGELTSITIPSSVTSIGEQSFRMNSKLASIFLILLLVLRL